MRSSPAACPPDATSEGTPASRKTSSAGRASPGPTHSDARRPLPQLPFGVSVQRVPISEPLLHSSFARWWKASYRCPRTLSESTAGSTVGSSSLERSSCSSLGRSCRTCGGSRRADQLARARGRASPVGPTDPLHLRRDQRSLAGVVRTCACRVTQALGNRPFTRAVSPRTASARSSPSSRSHPARRPRLRSVSRSPAAWAFFSSLKL